MNSARTLAPLPQAPTADVPAGLTVEGAARTAWRPNTFLWVAVWRALVVAEMLVATLILDVGLGKVALGIAAGYAAVSFVWARRRPEGRALLGVLAIDAVACVAVVVAAQEPITMALCALYSYSLVVSWAGSRPVDAWIAGGIGAGAYLWVALQVGRPSSFLTYFALYFFFALAVSGFFTIARRIAALEVATEIAKERGRYRRDLHDRLGQALCGLHFELQAVRASGVAEGVDARLRSLADGYRDARAMLADLFRQTDEPLVATNVATLIQGEARRLAQQSGTQIDVAVSGDPTRIPAWIRPHVWAVAGECMTNALKNGHADSVQIELEVAQDSLVLSATDDGVGFDAPPGELPVKEGHYGLREMAERARICGGDVVVASQEGFGTRVRLTVPLPENGGDDIIERDASRLRDNVAGLLGGLRAGLGAVALAQTVSAAVSGELPGLAGTALCVFVTFDLVLPLLRKRFALGLPAIPLGVRLLAYGVALAVSFAAGVMPFFMLYAPLTLIEAGVRQGRRAAGAATAFFSLLVPVAYVVSGSDEQSVSHAAVMVMANVLIVGMSAAQGARLLDRLEALQIRVRYQALARLRQGLSSRMRDQLSERLERLEQATRELVEAVPDPGAFEQATGELEAGSTDMKSRLREIVHQLADPPPNRERQHV